MASRIFLTFVLFTVALSMVSAVPVKTKQDSTTDEQSTLELPVVKTTEFEKRREGRQFIGGSGSNAQAQSFSSSNSMGVNPYLGVNPYFGGVPYYGYPGYGLGMTGSNSQAMASANSGSTNIGYGK